MTNDVAIIGVGLHPFGRFDKTAMQMGAEAIRSRSMTPAWTGKNPVRLRRQPRGVQP